jgi:hypothetical protein
LLVKAAVEKNKSEQKEEKQLEQTERWRSDKAKEQCLEW